MKLNQLVEVYQFFWMLKSHQEQRLAWKDAEEARIARQRAEAHAASQLEVMLISNPSGSLGDAKLNDKDSLRKSGLLR